MRCFVDSVQSEETIVKRAEVQYSLDCKFKKQTKIHIIIIIMFLQLIALQIYLFFLPVSLNFVPFRNDKISSPNRDKSLVVRFRLIVLTIVIVRISHLRFLPIQKEQITVRLANEQ